MYFMLEGIFIILWVIKVKMIDENVVSLLYDKDILKEV